MHPFILITPSTRGLSLALTRHLLRTTTLPVYATHRSSSPTSSLREHILSNSNAEICIDPSRLTLLPLDLTNEESIKTAAEKLPKNGYIHTAFLTAGVLHPEKQPADLNEAHIRETFQINTISHLLLIKHFSRFLPTRHTDTNAPFSKWVHITARVGSVTDNRTGGWYSYRASKAALNQIIKTFDLQLQMSKTRAICVGVHPGTMRTELSRDFWGSVEKAQGRLLDPQEAAENIVGVVDKLNEDQRGKVWDYKGEQVPW